MNAFQDHISFIISMMLGNDQDFVPDFRHTKASVICKKKLTWDSMCMLLLEMLDNHLAQMLQRRFKHWNSDWSVLYTFLLQFRDSMKINKKNVALHWTWILPVHPCLELRSWTPKSHYLVSNPDSTSLLVL